MHFFRKGNVFNHISIDKKITLPIATVALRSDHIIHIHVTAKYEFTIDDAKQLTQARVNLSGEKSHPILYTTNEKYVVPSQEVKEYSASEERSRLVLADAFVVNTLLQELMVGGYKKINKPVKPTKTFRSKKKAIEWLRTFVEDNDSSH